MKRIPEGIPVSPDFFGATMAGVDEVGEEGGLKVGAMWLKYYNERY
jgi:hypothetical protein